MTFASRESYSRLSKPPLSHPVGVAEKKAPCLPRVRSATLGCFLLSLRGRLAGWRAGWIWGRGKERGGGMACRRRTVFAKNLRGTCILAPCFLFGNQRGGGGNVRWLKDRGDQGATVVCCGGLPGSRWLTMA